MKAALFLTLLAPFFIPAAHAAGFPKLQQQFQGGMAQVFQSMISRLGDPALPLASGKSIKLSALQEKTKSIEFLPRQFLFTGKSAGKITCVDLLQYQWLTAADSESGRPTIGYPGGTTLQGAAGSTWRLLFHESISALGFVDDEYQISATLFAALGASDRSEQMRILSGMKKIEVRQHAPKYSFDSSVTCYKWKGMEGARISDSEMREAHGNSTGVGGGGNEFSLAFKQDLLQRADSWWRQHNEKRYSESDYEKFISYVSPLGIEPLDSEKEELLAVFPIQLEFRKSKRTGRLSAYLALDRLSWSRESSGSDTWSAALNKVLSHVYKQMLPAKTEKQRNRHTIYGNNLAHTRGLIGENVSIFEDGGPYFPKESK